MPEELRVLPESVRAMSDLERSEAQMRVAMSSPTKMKEWLEASGRSWIIFNARQLVDSFLWPEGARMFQLAIANYRDHRAGLPEPLPEQLTVDELDRAIRFLTGEITRIDPNWKLTDEPR